MGASLPRIAPGSGIRWTTALSIAIWYKNRFLSESGGFMMKWTTSGRLLKLGEAIEFHFSLPAGTGSGDLTIFPRYLESAYLGDVFVAGGDLGWLDAIASERFTLTFADGHASFTYHPDEPGNYLARWSAGGKAVFRYFSVVEDDWIVLCFSTFSDLESEPTLHATGIPLDYRLPVEQFDPDNPLFQKFLGYHQEYGDNIIPAFPDTPRMSMEERIEKYGKELEKARSMLPDGNDIRSARLEMHHDRDPGYTQTLMRLGVNDHCGLWEANAKPWLGMPEFPYFSSPVDCRKVNQEEGGSVVAHQWDFCGGWHFLGPVSWHYGASEGEWERTERCLRHGMKEAKNLAELSGHPAFLTPFYDGVTRNTGFANGQFNERFEDERMLRFVNRYQRFMAFELTKEYKLAYTRSIDIVDYYRRHFRVTPRTVFVSTTDHLMYDMWWLCDWYNRRNLLTRERIPWLTRISTIMELRKTMHPYKDPLSCEYILVEDQKRSIRFERESPNPIWWFDYAKQECGEEGSRITHVETPDVEVVTSPWLQEDDRLTVTLQMKTGAVFPDYAIALWGVPAAFPRDLSTIQTDAKEFVLAKNTEGEFHLILFFDLHPDAEIHVTLLLQLEGGQGDKREARVSGSGVGDSGGVSVEWSSVEWTKGQGERKTLPFSLSSFVSIGEEEREGDDLHTWWDGLDRVWRDIFRKAIQIDRQPTGENLLSMTCLEKLWCCCEDIENLEPLRQLENLRVLECWETPVRSLEPLGQLMNLEELSCYRTPIRSLESLKRLTKLRILRCGETNIESLEPLEQLTNLEELYCSSTPVRSLEPLRQLTNLRILRCRSIDVDQREIEKFQREHPNCLIQDF
jgi:hypothetical protein